MMDMKGRSIHFHHDHLMRARVWFDVCLFFFFIKQNENKRRSHGLLLTTTSTCSSVNEFKNSFSKPKERKGYVKEVYIY